MSIATKTGLVLSGGGAKGAYHAGVLRALGEINVKVDMVSGASIGALNGGVLAGAPTFSIGVERVTQLWETLAESSPLKVNPVVYMKMLVAAGSILLPQARIVLLALGASESPILSEEPLSDLMDQYLDVDNLLNGLPLYVSVYKSLGGLADISRCFAAAVGLRNTPDSDFFHLQSLPEAEIRNALLASAALPMLFQARKVAGKPYTDGGQGGWKTAQGNTPIQPLIDAGCTRVIVAHLSDGSLWSRQDFPDTEIIEIRPGKSIARGTGLLAGAKDLLGFEPGKIPSWMQQGHEDTLRCIGRVSAALEAQGLLASSRTLIEKSERDGYREDEKLKKLIARLKKN